MADEPKKPSIAISTEPNRPTPDPVPFYGAGSRKHPDPQPAGRPPPSRDSGISRAPAPPPKPDDYENSLSSVREAVQRASRISAERDVIRGDLERAHAQHNAPAVDPAPAETHVTNAPAQGFLAYMDRGVFGLCELFGLLFGLPFGDDLYHDKPVTGWHYFYLLIGILFAAGGPMFPWIRTWQWVPPRCCIRAF